MTLSWREPRRLGSGDAVGARAVGPITPPNKGMGGLNQAEAHLALGPRRVLRVFGWTYVVYHSAFAAFFLVSAFQDVVLGYWREPDFLLEMLFVVLVYPAIVPCIRCVLTPTTSMAGADFNN